MLPGLKVSSYQSTLCVIPPNGTSPTVGCNMKEMQYIKIYYQSSREEPAG